MALEKKLPTAFWVISGILSAGLIILLIIYFRNTGTAKEANAAKKIQTDIVKANNVITFDPTKTPTTGNVVSWSGTSQTNPVGLYSTDGNFDLMNSIFKPGVALGSISQNQTDLGNDYFYKIIDPTNTTEYYVAKIQTKVT